jgi:hypothetical protein
LTGLGRHLLRTHLSIEPRTLGVCRILFGVALWIDLSVRWRELPFWYTDTGLLPGAAMRYMHSPFLLASTAGEARLWMAICAVAFTALTLGVLTPVAQVLSFVCVTSLNNRIGVMENGGDIVLNLLGLWTLFLPMGRRFSIDALWRSRRAAAPVDRPVVSLVVLALLLQLAVIYLFNCLNKTGQTWSQGVAVYYVVQGARLTTPLAFWAREHLPLWVFAGLTHATLWTEGAAVLLILTPFWTGLSRLVAILGLTAMHVGFMLFLELGPFSYAMIALLSILLTHEHWAWLDRRRGRAPAEAPPVFVPPTASVLRRTWIFTREALVLLLLACAFVALRSNPSWPEALAFTPPRVLDSIVQYPRLFQSWFMFAPDAPRFESTITVTARTAGGRFVDPYNEVASPALPHPIDPLEFHERFLREGFPRLGQSQFFAAYSERIERQGWDVFHPALRDWILRYPERTGNPQDAIVHFEVCRLSALCGKPGGPPGKRSSYCFMSGPD